MNRLSTLTVIFLLLRLTAFSQTETHDFTTYDSTFRGVNGSWLLRISRPKGMFTGGSADTASRPAIITMPGVGEMGSTDESHLWTYGPHYWLNNGWDGSVVLGNGTHYPILITVSFIDNPWPTPQGGAEVLTYLLKTYHIKRNSVHLGGLSQGAFTWTAMIAYEATAGAETGMKLATSVTALEGFTVSQSNSALQSISRGDAAYGVWAQKYGGKYFGLEGTADYRNVAEGAKAMNSVVKGSAHFSYENIGGGGHCCWNTMYDPKVQNWQSFAPMGTYVATGADTNARGTYKIGSSIFQWMLRQGDTTLVTAAGLPSGPAIPLSYIPIPATVQGEAYTAMSGVNIEATTDAGGGQDVGGVDYGDWMDYNIASPSAGVYTLNFRVASASANAGLQVLDASGKVLATVSVPNTGGWQNWTTVTATVTLPSGNQKLRILDNTWAHWNLNWVQFVSGGSNGATIPGYIQAETYSAQASVATENTNDVGGGLDVGWIDYADWMDYNVYVATAGVYNVAFRVSVPAAGSTVQILDASGKVLQTVALPSTGNFNNWQTVYSVVTLPAGNQKLRIYNNSWTHWNFNWMSFTYKSAAAVGAQAVSAQSRSFAGDSATATRMDYFRVYPNPVRDVVTLNFSNSHTGSVRVMVITPSGQVVRSLEYQKSLPVMQTQVNVNGLASGIYIIRVQGEDWYEVRKIEKL